MGIIGIDIDGNEPAKAATQRMLLLETLPHFLICAGTAHLAIVRPLCSAKAALSDLLDGENPSSPDNWALWCEDPTGGGTRTVAETLLIIRRLPAELVYFPSGGGRGGWCCIYNCLIEKPQSSLSQRRLHVFEFPPPHPVGRRRDICRIPVHHWNSAPGSRVRTLLSS